MKRKESEIKKACMDWLKIQPNTFVWVNYTTGIPDGVGGFNKNPSTGIADICGVYKIGKIGLAFAFEVKSEKGKASEDQLDWLQRFDKAGGYACVVRSIEDVQEAFNEIRLCKL